MTTRYVDFALADDGSNDGLSVENPRNDFTGVTNGDVVYYLGGSTWTNTATLSISNTDFSLLPYDSTSKLYVNSYDTYAGTWTEVATTDVDGTATASGTGWWFADTSLTPDNGPREVMVWPGARDCLLTSLIDADAIGGANFIANYRKDDGKFRRINYIDTNGTTFGDSTPSLEGQWCAADDGSDTYLWIYTGNSNNPTEHFGNVYWSGRPIWEFTNCNITFDMSGIRVLSCGHAIRASVTGTASTDYAVTINDMNVTHCYKALFATAGGQTEDLNSNYMHLTVNRPVVKYSDGPPIHCKFHFKSSVIADGNFQYTSLGDCISGSVYAKTFALSGEEFVVERCTVKYVPYGNTWNDGYGSYSESGSKYVIHRYNKYWYCRSGPHLGGSAGPEYAHHNEMFYCGQMGRCLDASNNNATEAYFLYNTGRYIDPDAHMPWLNGTAAGKGAIDVHSTVNSAVPVEVKGNLIIGDEGIAAGNTAIRAANAAVLLDESHNVQNGFDTFVYLGTAITEDATDSESTQAFLASDSMKVNATPAKDNGVVIAGISDGVDAGGLLCWPDTPDIGARTVYPAFVSTRNLI